MPFESVRLSAPIGRIRQRGAWYSARPESYCVFIPGDKPCRTVVLFDFFFVFRLFFSFRSVSRSLCALGRRGRVARSQRSASRIGCVTRAVSCADRCGPAVKAVPVGQSQPAASLLREMSSKRGHE